MGDKTRIEDIIDSNNGLMKDEIQATEDPKFIERILRREFKDPELVVDSVSVDIGSEVVQNFLSALKRATVTGKYGGANGKGAFANLNIAIEFSIELDPPNKHRLEWKI